MAAHSAVAGRACHGIRMGRVYKAYLLLGGRLGGAARFVAAGASGHRKDVCRDRPILVGKVVRFTPDFT